jgi:hypothetical protein
VANLFIGRNETDLKEMGVKTQDNAPTSRTLNIRRDQSLLGVSSDIIRKIPLSESAPNPVTQHNLGSINQTVWNEVKPEEFEAPMQVQSSAPKEQSISADLDKEISATPEKPSTPINIVTAAKYGTHM